MSLHRNRLSGQRFQLMKLSLLLTISEFLLKSCLYDTISIHAT